MSGWGELCCLESWWPLEYWDSSTTTCSSVTSAAARSSVVSTATCSPCPPAPPESVTVALAILVMERGSLTSSLCTGEERSGKVMACLEEE